MSRKKWILVILIVIVVAIVFSLIVIFAFNSVQGNPIDKIAITYIRNSTSIQDQYGEIVSIGRNVIDKVEETENTKSIPYQVETKDYRMTIYVQLEKKEQIWEAISLNIKEVISNTN